MSSKDIPSKKFSGVVHRVTKKGNKTFYAIYKHPIEKITKRVKIGTDKEGINEQYVFNIKNELLLKARLGEDPNIPILKAKQHKETIRDLATTYLDHIFSTKGNTSNARQVKSRYFRRIDPIIGDLQLTQLTKNHVKKMQRDFIKEGLAPTTINHIITLITTIINYNINNDEVKGVNPLKGIKHLKTDSERTRYLTLNEISQLKEELKKDSVLYFFTMLALSTGARIHALLAIQKKDIDLTNNIIKVHDFKSGGTYQVGITDKVKPLVIEALKGIGANGYLVSHGDGVRLKDKQIQNHLQPILNKLFNKDLDPNNRLDRVVIHTFRHTFASLLAIGGTPIFTIQKLMNHKSISMTSRYAKLAPDSGQDAVNKLF